MLIPALCREHVTLRMFFTTHALPSLTSAEGCPPLFGSSQVLRHGPTSPARACPHCGLWPSRTGLDRQTNAPEISRFSCMLFLSVRGFLDYAGPDSHSRNNAAAVLPSSSSEWSRHPVLPAFRSSMAPPTDASGLRFKEHLAMSPARLEVRMDSLLPFL
jgi:hypothetical protein